jgi:transposase-like protein
MVIDDATRDRVLALARSGRSRNAIAREVGCGTSTVSRICRAGGVSFVATARTTRAATEVRQADQAARRTELAGGILGDISVARTWLAQAEDARELRDTAQAIRSLADAHARLAMVPGDSTAELDGARSMLVTLHGALTGYAAGAGDAG